jgi:heterodisulfide reductase subunit B
MKNAVFSDIKTRLLIRFEVFTAVTMKNGVFWVVTTCGSCKNRRFGGTWRLLHPDEDTILQVAKILYNGGIEYTKQYNCSARVFMVMSV